MEAGYWDRAATEYCWQRVGTRGKTFGMKVMSTGGSTTGAREMIEGGELEINSDFVMFLSAFLALCIFMILTKVFVEYLLQPLFSYIIFPSTRISVHAVGEIALTLLSPSTPHVVFWLSVIFLPVIYSCYYNLPFNNAAVVIDRIERLGKERFRDSESLEDIEELRLLDEIYGSQDFLKYLYLLPLTRLGIAINVLQLWRQIWNTSIATFVVKVIIAGWTIAVRFRDHIKGQTDQYCRHVAVGCKCFTANVQHPGAQILQDAITLAEKNDFLTRERDTAIEKKNKFREKVEKLAKHRKNCKDTHQAFRAQDFNLQQIDKLQTENDRLVEDNRQLNAKLADIGRNRVSRAVEIQQNAYVRARDNHREQMHRLTAALAESETQVATLEDEIRKLKEDLNTSRNGSLLSINQKLQNEISKLTKDLFDADRQHNIELQLKDEQIENESLRLLLRLDGGGQARIRQLETLIKKRDKDLATCIIARDKFERDAKEHAEEIERMKEKKFRTEALHLKDLLNNAQKELFEKEERLNTLEFFSKVENSVEAVEEECARRQTVLETVNDDLKRQISVFHQQIDRAWDDLDWSVDKFGNRDRYTVFVPEAYNEIRRQQDDVWKMKYQLRQMGTALNAPDLDDELANMRDEDNKYRDEAFALRGLLNESEKKVANLQAKVAYLERIEEALTAQNGRTGQMDTQDVPLSRPTPRTSSRKLSSHHSSPTTNNPVHSPILDDNLQDAVPEPPFREIYTKPSAFDMRGWNVDETASTFRTTTRIGHELVHTGVSAIVALLQSIRAQKPGIPLGQTSNLALLNLFEDRFLPPAAPGRAYSEYQVAQALSILSQKKLYLVTVRKKRGHPNEEDSYTFRTIFYFLTAENESNHPAPIYLFLEEPDIWRSMSLVGLVAPQRDQVLTTASSRQWDGPTPFQAPPGCEIDENTATTYQCFDGSGNLVRRTNVSSINAVISSFRSQYPDSPIGMASPDELYKRLQELFPSHTGEYGIAQLQALLSDSNHPPLYALRVVEPAIDGEGGYVSTIEIFGPRSNPEIRPELLVYHTAYDINAPWKGMILKKEENPSEKPFPTFHDIVIYDMLKNFDTTPWEVDFNKHPEVDRFADLAQALHKAYRSQYLSPSGAVTRGQFPYTEWRDVIAREFSRVGPNGSNISKEHHALQQFLDRQTFNSVRLNRIQAVIKDGSRRHWSISLKSCAPAVVPSICAEIYLLVDEKEQWQAMTPQGVRRREELEERQQVQKYQRPRVEDDLDDSDDW
ncbi:hypothetical protein ACMFMG_002852 [Clarireedia jacksonii]